MDSGSFVTGVLLHPPARKLAVGNTQPGNKTSHYICVYSKTWAVNLCNRNYFYLKKCGVCINGRKIRKGFQKKRGKYRLFLRAKQRQKNLYIREEAVKIMKQMNPQQLANILFPNDVWHVKTSTGNASRN